MVELDMGTNKTKRLIQHLNMKAFTDITSKDGDPKEVGWIVHGSGKWGRRIIMEENMIVRKKRGRPMMRTDLK